MVRIAITQAAFNAIAKTLSLGSVGYEDATNEKGERLIWLELLLARQLTRSTVLSAQISILDTSADLPSAYFPRRSTWQFLPCGTLAHVPWPAFSAPSTFFQLTEPLPTTWSSTRSASRQFVTFTVTVPPAGVLGLDFMGAAAADSEF